MKISMLEKQFVIKDEQKPFDSCHASTLVQTKSGVIVAAWFAGTRESSPDTAIWTSRRADGKWEAPRKTADVRGTAMWNPVLFQKQDGTIILFYKVGERIPEWRTWTAESHDEGATFTEPREMVCGDDSGGRGPVKNKPVRLKDGTVLAPGSLEGEYWDCFVDISTDDCDSWERSSLVPVRRASCEYHRMHRPYDRHYVYGKGILQPALWQDDKEQVHMLLRSTSSRIFRSDSFDGGHTWCVAYDTGLPNNNSGIDLVRRDSGELILVYNPRENLPGMFHGPRTPLTVAVSADNGAHFDRVLDLEDTAGVFCYPAVICGQNGEILLTYTWNRENIMFVRLGQ
ncbi:MAG: exo-alpha-sialidase [Hungatella sp.]|nr:exo-alpha-sialidase [Hungatella sp.]